MTSMARHNSQYIAAKHRTNVSALLRVAVIAMALTTAPSLHAADERPIKQRVAPTYPEIAKRMRVSGMVKVAATVEPNGSVSATKTISGNRMLSEAAEDAVHKWKFVPGPDQSTVEVEINFALTQ
jgi:TonB family protein